MCITKYRSASKTWLWLKKQEFAFPSAVRGFHVYPRVWVPRVGQRLNGEREDGNTEDRFAVGQESLVVKNHSIFYPL